MLKKSNLETLYVFIINIFQPDKLFCSRYKWIWLQVFEQERHKTEDLTNSSLNLEISYLKPHDKNLIDNEKGFKQLDNWNRGKQ